MTNTLHDDGIQGQTTIFWPPTWLRNCSKAGNSYVQPIYGSFHDAVLALYSEEWHNSWQIMNKRGFGRCEQWPNRSNNPVFACRDLGKPREYVRIATFTTEIQNPACWVACEIGSWSCAVERVATRGSWTFRFPLRSTKPPIQCVHGAVVLQGVKKQGSEPDLSLPVSVDRNGGSTPPFSHMSSRRAVQLIKHRNGFTLLPEGLFRASMITVYLRTLWLCSDILVGGQMKSEMGSTWRDCGLVCSNILRWVWRN
jgi:hypothetical protein